MNIPRKPKPLDPLAQPGTTGAASPEQPAPKRSLKRRLRMPLLILGPLLVLLVGGYIYATGGRYVSTDNAYIRGHKVSISAQVSGQIIAVDAIENQPVKRGATLFTIDPEPFRVTLARAEALMEKTRNDLLALKATYNQKQEQLHVAKANLDFARSEYERQAGLAKKKIVSASKFDEAKRNLDVARRNFDAVRYQLTQTLASLGGDPNLPIERYPAYLEARAEWEKAALDLRNTLVRAPFDGYASQVPERGAYVRAGTPVMSVVSGTKMWIEANFRETDLTYVKPGQKVTISVDTYPDRTWTGTVASIARASTAEFSVLPAQNSSGNWVKVVQRIAVRIAVVHHEGDPPLRAGMSTSVEIDTGHSNLLLFSSAKAAPAATSAGPQPGR
jgi:membrane fusion protein (multidrug efflux system)